MRIPTADHQPRVFLIATFVCVSLGLTGISTRVLGFESVRVVSSDGRNAIELRTSADGVTYEVHRDGKLIIQPSIIGPKLRGDNLADSESTIAGVERTEIDQRFPLLWGNADEAADRCSSAIVSLVTTRDVGWEVQLRAYDDGVAFRYCLPSQPDVKDFTLTGEETEFRVAGDPIALFNTLDSFTTSHESLYERKRLADVPTRKLMDCPLLLTWPQGPAAAITEARVFDFAGMYLCRESERNATLRTKLSPLPSRPEVCVTGKAPHASPWRVVLLADEAGRLVESNLLMCLNDPPDGDFSWARPGKSTFHWWYGDFEDDYKQPNSREAYVARHKKYIDFCAESNIAYHALSGNGLSWYQQSSTDYAKASADADVRKPRPEIGLPEVLAYARKRGVGIRLWVHWEALNKHLDEAMALYHQWGVKGLMVDFLDRDDQEMIEFSERMLAAAARHKIHIQIHGSSKYSGEHRSFPHLFNREGVLNLEYVKWSKLCTPQHSVNVAYTRALAGPVDFHLGGFRSVSREEFKPRDRKPVVMGTRCHNLALYVVYVNPMPMVADAPESYADQTGFEFIREVPNTWDETRYVVGKPGEYFIVARRSGSTWYLAGITNWTPRNVDVPLDFLGSRQFRAKCWVDGSLDPSHPNKIRIEERAIHSDAKLTFEMASGGGFVAKLSPN